VKLHRLQARRSVHERQQASVIEPGGVCNRELYLNRFNDPRMFFAGGNPSKDPATLTISERLVYTADLLQHISASLVAKP